MTNKEWVTLPQTILKSRKQYAHFDYRTDIGREKDYIVCPDNIAKHGFYPFIHYEKRMIKYNKEKGRKEKTRDICYAAHIDRCIFQYYSYNLNEIYNNRIKELEIDMVPIAYRTDLKQSNVHFAERAFDFIKASSTCFVMIGDFTSFFDRLDHRYLKQRWCDLLQVGTLPDDHYAVFKNITRYSKWELTDLLEINGLPDTDTGRRKLNDQALVITKEQFKQYRSHTQRNVNDYGIPQGSPISALLANIYMIDVDKAIHDLVSELNGMYMRYSDDFIIVLPLSASEITREKINCIIRLLNNTPGLTLEPNKTQFFQYEDGKLENCGETMGIEADCSNRFINFLGFTFDGKKVSIRSKTTSKYYYRMYRKAKNIAATGGYSPRGKHISGKNLYERYSIKGAFGQKGNYLTYINRSLKVFGSNEDIDRDTKRHMQKIRKRLKREKG